MIGQTISHYRILEKLGEGGMGVVYRAEDTLLKRTVALKFLPPTLTFDDEARQRFIHEAQAASALDHPNICTIHDIGETDEGQTFIVMACYEGKSLKRKIEDGELKIEDGIELAIQIAQGLVAAHEHGIIHREIKPANIIVTNDGTVKIVDFGLAKLAGGTMLSRTGSTLGTTAYMSPEQARDERVDAKSDIWSLGVLIYEMFTGRRPFESEQESAQLYSIMNEEPRPIRSLKPDIPEALEQIIQRAMAKEPEKRYQTADDLLADLNILKGDNAGGRRTLAGRLARRKILRRAAVVAGLICLIAAGVFFLTPILQEDALASNPRHIVVVSFENQTGDRKLDYLRIVLQDAIITSLEQSKYFRVTTRERMADILKQMGKGNPEYVDNTLGREICRNVGSEIMAVGKFASAGERFQMSMRLVDVNTLEALRSFTTGGSGVESLLGEQVDQLTKDISQGFGVSPRKTEESIHPIAETMTTSIDAYNFYIRGVDACDKMYYAEARRFLERAVQKDSTFAMAWFWLAQARGGTEDVDGQDRAWRKASAFAGKATEKEKFFIALYDSSLRVRLVGPSGVDHLQFLKNCTQKFPLEKRFWYTLGWTYKWHLADDSAVAAQTKALELDHTFGPALNELAYAYYRIGDFEKCVETFKRYAAASPGDANPYDGLAEIYWSKGMYDDAIATYEQAIDVKPDWDLGYASIAAIYLHDEEYDQAFRWIDSGITRASSPGRKAEAMWRRAYCLHWLGRMKDAETELRKRDTVLAGADLKPQYSYLLQAWIAYERSDFKRSRTLLRKWGGKFLSENLDGTIRQYLIELEIQLSLGFVDLKAGQLDSVVTRLSCMDDVRSKGLANLVAGDSAAFPRAWSLRHDLLAGFLYLARGNPREALAVAPFTQFPKSKTQASSSPTILSYMEEGTSKLHYIPVPHDLVPAAYVAMGRPDSAIAAYERAVSTQSTTFVPIIPRYHYRLARIYEQAGMKDKAIAEYRKFLKIWGKADRVFKEPKDARKRISRLTRHN
jgi:eukaryotic-like serine/threonine-protein kinase